MPVHGNSFFLLSQGIQSLHSHQATCLLRLLSSCHRLPALSALDTNQQAWQHLPAACSHGGSQQQRYYTPPINPHKRQPYQGSVAAMKKDPRFKDVRPKSQFRYEERVERGIYWVKVVLLEDIPGVGSAGDVRSLDAEDVRTKYFPKEQVLYATPENLARYALTREQKAARLNTPEEQAKRLSQLLDKLDTRAVNIRRYYPSKSGAQDIMLGYVTVQDIRTAVAVQLRIQLDESHLFMEEPISSFGIYKIPLNLRNAENKQIELTVNVNRVGDVVDHSVDPDE